MCQDFPSFFICFYYDHIDAFIKYFVDNIWGGVLASIIFWIICYIPPKIKKKLSGKKFKKIFGNHHMDEDYPLACGKVYSTINAGGNFVKPKTNSHFTISSMISHTDITAYDYLKKSFFTELGVNVRACMDEDMVNPKSYCSFGCLNNVLTLKILNDPKNTFYAFARGFVNKRTNATYNCHGRTDYGVIIKITDDLTKSVQICVAGLGESGTTGAAYFLANRWMELVKKFDDADFGCIIEVTNLYDPSAKMVDCEKAS